MTRILRPDEMSRRQFLGAAACAALQLPLARAEEPFRLKYILNSAMYGTFKVAEILPEVSKIGARHIDIWPRVHGNQREQVEEMGHEAFAALLKKHEVRLGISTCYKLGPFGLQSEMKFVRKLAGPGGLLVTGARWPKGAKGKPEKEAVRLFVEAMKPHIEAAEKQECIISVENHANSLLQSPESMRLFAEMTEDSPHIGIAFAPHHLAQDAEKQAALIRELGAGINFFYAQQHGTGSKKKQPKEKELLQMPGRGELDFGPLVKALAAIRYSGFTEIFMHPYPRGLPILPTIPEITAEINRSRAYLDALA